MQYWGKTEKMDRADKMQEYFVCLFFCYPAIFRNCLWKVLYVVMYDMVRAYGFKN